MSLVLKDLVQGLPSYFGRLTAPSGTGSGLRESEQELEKVSACWLTSLYLPNDHTFRSHQ